MGNDYGLQLYTAPAGEPVTLAEAKEHLRVEITNDDPRIASLITAARITCEQELGQSFITQTWKLTLDRFPCGELRLPKPPLIAVSSITYRDSGSVTQTLDASTYSVDTTRRPGRLLLAFGEAWPAIDWDINAVTITYTAGYGGAPDVPETIKQAILLLVGHWYENREQVVLGGGSATDLPRAVDSLLMASWHGTY